MEAAFKTHIGRVRQTNEDAGAIQSLQEGWVLAIVADGMGGHKAGDVASQMAVERISAHLHGLSFPMDITEIENQVDSAIYLANQEIFQYAKDNPECSGMGTTVVIAVVNEHGGVLAHIGDSRIYRWHEGQLQLLTNDHTLVNELLKNHQITPEEAITHPRRNIITRAVGTDEVVEADFSMVEWQVGDLLLLCSDGLHGKVPQEEMERILQEVDLEKAAEELVHLALEAGGQDNITVALLKHNKPGHREKGGTKT
ncbi:MAG TPA: Stp1/IreP family PP2C-type Ser/Thr phosphatase [Paenibacillaceae bacterium]|nr:Stp1/IreP family PP2C-type Ser/Thr phosphatase [Paenibacillaceae bacterium]